MTARAIKAICADPIEGIVLQTFGAGNAPDNRKPFLDAIKEASDRGCIILNTTQCYQGNVAAHYATGAALVKCGVIPGHDMTVEAAYTKLSYVCAMKNKSLAEKKEMIKENIRGEFTIPVEPEAQRFSWRTSPKSPSLSSTMSEFTLSSGPATAKSKSPSPSAGSVKSKSPQSGTPLYRSDSENKFSSQRQHHRLDSLKSLIEG